MFRKYFTPLEANRRLPLIRQIVEDILVKGQEYRKIMHAHEGKEEPQQGRQLIEEVEALMEELENLGCYYKDWNFSIGLVDFPALIENREVFLCWRSDEKDVRFYHPVEAGYAGRTPIPQELLN